MTWWHRFVEAISASLRHYLHHGSKTMSDKPEKQEEPPAPPAPAPEQPPGDADKSPTG